nr:hypothetical protein [Tanacetum cinerariifolium]
MLDKPIYESWKSCMELYIQGKDHGWIILNSVENGPLIWPTTEQEDDTVRFKTYEELSDKEKLQTDCDLKETNIVLQGLAVPTFLPGDDPIAYMNKAMAFSSAVFSPRYPSTKINLDLPPIQGIKPLFNMVESPFSKFKEDKVRMSSVQDHKRMLQVHKGIHQVKQKLLSAIIIKVKGTWLDGVLSQRGEGMHHGLRQSKTVNESLTAELERYKEQAKILEQIFNVDLSSHEKFIDSKMDDMIRMKNTKFAAFETKIDTLKHTLSKHVKGNESLLTTLNGFKTELKQRESKFIDKEIGLENKNKELENMV